MGNDFMKNSLPGELIINKLSFFKHSIILYILKPKSEFLSFYFCVYVSVCACVTHMWRSILTFCPLSLCGSQCVCTGWLALKFGALYLCFPSCQCCTGVTAGHDCTELCMVWGFKVRSSCLHREPLHRLDMFPAERDF